MSWTSTAIGAASLNGLWSSGGTALAVGDNGVIAQWDTSVFKRAVTPATSASVYSLWAGARNDFWVGGYTSAFHYDGTSWTKYPLGLAGPVTALWGSATNDVWLGGPIGGIYHWNGTSLSTVTIPGSAYALWGFAANNVWAAGPGGAIYRWNGTLWSAATGVVGDTISALWGSSSSDMWAVGSYIWHWNGTSWTLSLDIGSNFSAVWGSGPSDVWASSETGAWHYNGTIWVPVNESGVGRIGGGVLWGSSASDVWLWNGSLNRLQHWNGRNWLRSAAPTNIIAVSGLPGTSDLWACTSDSRLWRRY
jgi:hypothetical protein